MTKRVLVAVDGTPASSASLEIACALADSYDANLGLLCVVEPNETSEAEISAGINEGILKEPDFSSWQNSTVGAPNTFTWEAAQRGAYAQRLANIVAGSIVAEAEAFAKDGSSKAIKTFIRSGDVADAVLDVAASNQADLIVMGHDQQGRLESLIKSSVAEKVERNATCPCLIYCLPKGS